jgi:hypothetical protein
LFRLSTIQRYCPSHASPLGLLPGDVTESRIETVVAVGAVNVVKDRAVENALQSPATSFAATRQKYLLLLARGPTCRDASVIVESSNTVEENVELVET